MVIYEMHVRGFTRHPSSGAACPGTFAGVIEKIPYLQELGVTAVELLPVQQFDPQSVSRRNPFTGEQLVNYWGYEPIGFFAPHQGYSCKGKYRCAVEEFRQMVKALHQAKIEVILDVVFNHTAEGGARGPTISFRGLENRAYYLLEQDPSVYSNYSGTGNTLNCNHSIVRRLIMDCLRYWVQEMHVDGFRFDLASILSRDEYGEPLENPPILWSIESDPVLANTKIIAEAWDAAGLYQVGSFIGDRWAEWNGRYRDDVRRFIQGEGGMVRSLAARLVGSPDLYADPDRQPHRSINFITCHDGFSLNDLVSYDEKHNMANGEENRDGHNANYSWNCGIEGLTDNPAIERLRSRQIKNLLAVIFVSQGSPMILMGDEARHTQRGNNNTYCQDNEISWFNWDLVEKNVGLFRFVKKIIRFNQAHPSLNSDSFISEVRKPDGNLKYLAWHGVRLKQPDWGDASHSLAFTLHDYPGDVDIHVILNAYWKPLEFELPPLPAGVTWRRVVDTSLDSPADISDEGDEPPVTASSYRTASRSVVILVAR
jgi:glycogen operon protein